MPFSLELKPFYFHFDHSRNLRLLYFDRILMDLNGRLALFFVPVFLFQLGSREDFDLFGNFSQLQSGFLAIGLYYFIFRFVVLLTTIKIGQISKLIGQSRSMFVGYIFYIFVALSLWQAQTSYLFIFVAAVAFGLHVCFYWPAFHSLLVSNTMKNHLGQDLGILQFILQLISIVSPAISGLIIVSLGFGNLFFLSAIFSLLAALNVLKIQDSKISHRPVLAEFFEWLKEKQYRLLSLSFIGKYFSDATLIVWPLYVLFILGSVDKVGYLYSFSLFLSLIFSFFIGIYIDHHKSRKPFFTSGWLLSAVWLLRTQVFGPISISLVDATHKVIANFHWLYYERILYRRGKGKKSFAYFVYREIVLAFAALLMWGSFMVIFIIWNRWEGLFVLAAIGVLMSLFMRERVTESH